MSALAPPQAWRDSQDWQHWIGKSGVVLGVTTVHVAEPDWSSEVPYQLALVEFATQKGEGKTAKTAQNSVSKQEKFQSEKRLLPVVSGQKVAIGETVCCVLRRYGQTDEVGLIRYGIKVERTP